MAEKETSAKEGWDLLDCPVCSGNDFDRLFEQRGEPFVRCRQCSFILINPRPNFASIAEGYNASYTSIYTKKAEKKIRRAKKTVKRLSRLAKGKERWLDLGCSAGYILLAASQAGFEPYGLDIEPESIRYARKELGLKKVVVGELTEQKYPDSFFDVITAYDVIEHVPDLNIFVSEIRRILKRDGLIEIGTPDVGHWRVPSELSQWKEIKPSEHLYYFTKSTLSTLLLKHGLRIRKRKFTLKPGIKAIVQHD